MQFTDIEVGMACSSKKGSGTVIWIDDSTRKVYMCDIRDEHCVEVDFNDLIEDPQAHNIKDAYY